MRRGPALRPETVRLLKDSQAHDRRDFGIKSPKHGMRDHRRENPMRDAVTGVVVYEGVPAVDQTEYHFLFPTIDLQLTSPGSSLTGRSIMEELMEDRLTRKVIPFVPGPIGAYKKRKPVKTYTLSNWPELDRKAMLELRKKNDADLKRLEERK